jgi:hypothetical protein
MYPSKTSIYLGGEGKIKENSAGSKFKYDIIDIL